MRRRLAPDRPGRIERELVGRKQLGGFQQFLHPLQQFLEREFLQFQFLQFFEFLRLLQFFVFVYFFQFVELYWLVLQFGRRIRFKLGEFVLRLRFVRRLRTEHEALSVG